MPIPICSFSRRLLSVACFVLFVSASTTFAQTSTFTYQGRLSDGGTAANGTYDLQFKLYDALTLGNLQGSPNTVTKTGVNVTNGVFTVQLDFGAGAFPGADRFLDIGVKHPADSSYTELLPRQQLTSTAYAIRAASTQTADNTLKLQGVAVSSSPPGANQVLKFNGSSSSWEPGNDSSSGGTVTSVSSGTGLMGGPITTSGTLSVDPGVIQNRVIGSCTGNSSISAISANGQVTCVTGNFVLKSGDTMTGALVLSGDPSTGLGAATKQYVDNADALKLSLSGGTMTGALNMGGNTIVGGSSASNNLTLDSTSNATKGEVRVNNGSNFRVYSDNALTAKFTVTGTNGSVVTPGLVIAGGTSNDASGFVGLATGGTGGTGTPPDGIEEGLSSAYPIAGLQVGSADISPVLGSAGWGRAIYFEGAPPLYLVSGQYSPNNTDSQFMARYNVASNQTELRMGIGDDANSSDKFVVGIMNGNTWTPKFSVDGTGAVNANAITAGNMPVVFPQSGRIEVNGPTGEFSLQDRQNAIWSSSDRWVFYHDTDKLYFFRGDLGNRMSLDTAGNVKAVGTITGSTTPDMAETIEAAANVEVGDVVCADPQHREHVTRCDVNARSVLGVISDGSGAFLINSHGGSVDAPLTGKPLVLVGRVPVKVSLENGPIRIGDYLAPSSTPGVAMRATQPGPTVGIALDAFAGSENNRNIQFGRVLAFVKVGEANNSSSIEHLSAENNLLKQQNAALQERLGRLEQTVGQLQLVSSAPRSRGQSKGVRQANSVIVSGVTRRATFARW